MDNTFYLLKNSNPYAEQHGWFYPDRNEKIQGIILHTGEHHPANEVANYYAKSKRKSSMHYVVDEKNIIALLPPEYTAFHTENNNAKSIGVEIAFYSDRWGMGSQKDELKILNNLAYLLAVLQNNFKIANRKVTATEWNSGLKGMIGHAELDPVKYKDPGINFDWVNLIRLIKEVKSQEF